MTEVRFACHKHRRSTQITDDRIQRQFLLDGKFRQLEIYHTVFHILRNLIQLLFIQTFHHFLDILALIWQKYQHAIATIAIRKIYSLEILVLSIEELLYLMHHFHFLDITCIATEVLQLSVLGIELVLPCSLEIDGIHQIRYCIG